MEGLVRRSWLDQGQAEAIAFASTRGLRLIVDNKEARSVGAAGMLLVACLGAHLDLEELEAIL